MAKKSKKQIKQNKVILDVWHKNKDKIVNAAREINPEWSERKILEQFKNRVYTNMDAYDLSVSKATKKTLNTEDYTSAGERSRTNFITGIKEKFSEDYKELRKELRDESGKFIKISDNLKWDKANAAYTIETSKGTLLIDVTNSPEELTWRYL